MKHMLNIEIKEVKEEISDEKSNRREPESVSIYAKWFDYTYIGLNVDSEHMLLFLRSIQNHMNNLLKVNRHVYLNDVYEELGIKKTAAGKVVGWIYDEKNPIGDNFIDFGIYDKRNRNFINGYTKDVLLDFNVDGDISNRVLNRVLDTKI